ncbi:hypothetical protein [Streptomyces sp. ALB3]|uniref:hypothetical protein n=1 Tax=Streptomyces sp. ALB3 TaxID=3374278 RepID=UPI0037A8CF3F
MSTSEASATVSGTGYASFLADHTERTARRTGGVPGPRAAGRPGSSPPPPALASAARERPGTPMYGELSRLWAARGSTLPGVPDPEWHRLVSYRHHQEETERTLRILRLQKNTPAM